MSFASFNSGSSTGPSPKPLKHRTSIVILVLMVVVRLSTLLIMLKLLAARFGPEGFGILTQVMGVAAIFYMFAGGGLINGIVKNVAEDDDPTSRQAWLSAAGTIAIGSSILLSAIALTLIFLWTLPIFADSNITPVLFVIGVSQILVGAGNISLAYLVGTGHVKQFVMANAVGSVVALVVVATLTYVAKMPGAVLGVAILPLAPSVIGIICLVRVANLGPIWPRIEKDKIKKLLGFAAVMVFSSTSVPLAQLYIRAHLGQEIGWEGVGYWQVVARLSDGYMQIFGVLFINFLLPNLSRRRGIERVRLLAQLGTILIALFLTGAFILFEFRTLVLRIAFSEQFLSSTQFVVPQLIGDFAKIGGLLIVYYFVASGRVWLQGAADVFQGAVSVAGFLFLLPTLGVKAPVTSHMLTCLSMLFVLAAIFAVTWRSHLKSEGSSKLSDIPPPDSIGVS